MDIETLTKLIKDWPNGTASNLFYFDKDTHEAWLGHDAITIEKFSKAGLAELNYVTGKFKLTQTGLDLYNTIWEYFRKGDLSPLPLVFRICYIEWLAPKPGEPIPVEGLRETAMHDRSARVRSGVARLLVGRGELDRKTANVLAKDKDAEVRQLASEYADPHLFFNEMDARIVGHMVQIGVADKACFRHSTSLIPSSMKRFMAMVSMRCATDWKNTATLCVRLPSVSACSLRIVRFVGRFRRV